MRLVNSTNSKQTIVTSTDSLYEFCIFPLQNPQRGKQCERVVLQIRKIFFRSENPLLSQIPTQIGLVRTRL